MAIRTPRNPISKEARDFLISKLDRMGKIERRKAEKRLEMYDRGLKSEKEVDWEVDK